MKVQTPPPRTPSPPPQGNTPPPPQPDPPEQPKEEFWWREIGLGHFLEKRLHLTQERIDSTIDSSRDLGKSVAVAWPNLNETVNKILSHPLLDRIPDGAQDRLACTVVKAAGAIGYTVAGVEGITGVAKLIQGFREGRNDEKLDGFLDLTASGAILSTLMGVGSFPLVLGPIAAGLGVARGSVRAVRAYQSAEPGKEVQGFLDATRSAKVMCSLLGYSFAAAATVGAVLGPVAAAIQACRGYVVLRSGMQKSDKPLQVSGLSDIATAAGLTLCFTGMAIPGISICVLSAAAQLLYNVCPAMHKITDKALDKVEGPIKNTVGKLERATDPFFHRIREWIDKYSPWKHGENHHGPKKD